MTTGRYQHKPTMATVEGPLRYGRRVANAVGRTDAEPGMYVVGYDAMKGVTRSREVRVLTAAELDFEYDPADREFCDTCHSARAHGTCQHVMTCGDQILIGRIAWEHVCDELALVRSRSRAHP